VREEERKGGRRKRGKEGGGREEGREKGGSARQGDLDRVSKSAPGSERLERKSKRKKDPLSATICP